MICDNSLESQIICDHKIMVSWVVWEGCVECALHCELYVKLTEAKMRGVSVLGQWNMHILFVLTCTCRGTCI